MPSSNPRPLESRIAILGMVLAATAALPVFPDGRSFAYVVWQVLGESVLGGLLTIAGFGSPFLFGLAVALARRTESPQLAARLVRTPIAMMHSQLVLVTWSVWRFGEAIAALPMFGFAMVSAIYFVWFSAKAKAEGDGSTGPELAWLVRWGAMVIAAVCMWARLQTFGGTKLGIAIDVAWLCAAGMILVGRGGPLARHLRA